MKDRLWVVVSWGCVLALLLGSVLPAQAQSAGVRAVLFYSPSCAHCHKVMTEDLPPLFEKYGEQLQMIAIDVSQQGGQALYQASIKRFKITPELQGVPMLIVGDVVLVGSLEIPQQFPILIEKHLASGGIGWPDIPGLSSIVPTPLPTAVPPAGAPTPAPTPPAAASQAPVKSPFTLDLPVLGQVDLDAHSLAFSTAIIGLVDGFNPCSLWVISLLLALVINTGSRKKALTVGLTYLVVAAGLYGLIMLGLFSAFAVIGYALWIRIAVALIALTFAVVNIKDYFWFKTGVSFTISDEHKPGIYRSIRNILAPGKSGLGLVGATAAMAGGITLIEMPCTAGLPILWTKLITANNVGGVEFGLLLGLYLVLFMLDEMAVFISAVVTLKAARLEEKEGRILKLIGGVVMLALAIVLLIDPTLMDSVRNSLLIFGAAFALAATILLVHRLVLPRFGVMVGTETLTGKKPLGKSE